MPLHEACETPAAFASFAAASRSPYVVCVSGTDVHVLLGRRAAEADAHVACLHAALARKHILGADGRRDDGPLRAVLAATAALDADPGLGRGFVEALAASEWRPMGAFDSGRINHRDDAPP
mmetsp:Transcript_9590/g.31685  ORF Transcript_9590/g.31685 Transcript_9590/m.31685 type:complete len:121 (+) Transcript_9590:153-515(+)